MSPPSLRKLLLDTATDRYVRECAVQLGRSLHDLVKRDVPVGRYVDGPFLRDVAADPQRVANRHILRAAVRRRPLQSAVLVVVAARRGRFAAHVLLLLLWRRRRRRRRCRRRQRRLRRRRRVRRTLWVDRWRMRNDHGSANVVLVCGRVMEQISKRPHGLGINVWNKREFINRKARNVRLASDIRRKPAVNYRTAHSFTIQWLHANRVYQ